MEFDETFRHARYGDHGYNIDDDSDVESDDTNMDDSGMIILKRAICILLFHFLSLLLCGNMFFHYKYVLLL